MLAYQTGHLFLAGRGTHADDLVHHDLLDRLLGGGQDQLAQGQGTAQVALLIEDIGLIDRFGIGGLAAQHVDGLAGSEAGIEARVFAGHQVTGRAFAVAVRVQQVVATRLGGLAQVEGGNAEIGSVLHEVLQAPTQAPANLSHTGSSLRRPWRRRAQCQFTSSV
ncbi:hypothetical protein D3C79_851920 [compost metagenome]